MQVNMNTKVGLPVIAIEYSGSHWIILVRNYGHKKWEPLRSSAKKVRVQDEFGIEIKSYPAIESFASMADALNWANMNIAYIDIRVRFTSRIRALLCRLLRLFNFGK